MYVGIYGSELGLDDRVSRDINNLIIKFDVRFRCGLHISTFTHSPISTK